MAAPPPRARLPVVLVGAHIGRAAIARHAVEVHRGHKAVRVAGPEQGAVGGGVEVPQRGVHW